MKTNKLPRNHFNVKSLVKVQQVLFNSKFIATFFVLFIFGITLNAQSIPSWVDFKNTSEPAQLAAAKTVFSNVPTAYFSEGEWQARGEGEPIRLVITPEQLDNISALKVLNNIQVLKIEIEEMAHWSFLQTDALTQLSELSNLELVCFSVQTAMSSEALLQNLNTIKLDITTPAFYQYSVAE